MKMKEQEIINGMVVQIEKGLGMKCKVVPQSDKWYDGYCFDTSAIALQMYMGGLQDYLKFVKERIEEKKIEESEYPSKDAPKFKVEGGKEIDFTTITLINNGINRNLMRMGWEVPVED